MVDVTDATFDSDVMQKSQTTPVVVDLWAEWCGPCRQLTPILEKVIGATNGAVTLAKVNIDENPQIAQAFKVQSIPAVFAVKDGQVVDNFIGAQGEAMVQEFVKQLVPDAVLSEVDALLAQGDPASVQAALELEPDNPDAVVAMAELLIANGQPDDALELLQRVPETAETRRVAAVARAGEVDDIDRQLSELLAVAKDDEDARQRFVDLLEVLGPEHPDTPQWRKRLTNTLF